MKHEDEIFELEDLQVASLREAQIDKEVLVKIHKDYLSNQGMLMDQARYLGNTLQNAGSINSVKQRIKDPLHLLTKIVRKRKEALKGKGGDKYLNINVDNYKSKVNDLVGIRGIYLFKDNWERVNDFILSNFIVCEDECITIYHANDDDLSLYPKHNSTHKGFKYKLDTKQSRYRSTHYIIKGIPPYDFKFELQTRTILDEAWGEIDHHIRYPDFQHDLELERKMSILNGALSGCEELTSNYFNYFNEIRAKNESDSLKTDDQELTLMPRAQVLDLISDSMKVTDNTWDKMILEIALNREKERVLTSQEILRNKTYYEEIKNKHKIMEDLILSGAMKKLKDKERDNENSDTSKNSQKNQHIAKYKDTLKKLSNEIPLIEPDDENKK